MGQAHLRTFDTLDFDVYSNHKWDRLKEGHASDILVHYPDGHTSQGIPAHVDELKGLFTFAPDTKIHVHPVKIQSGGWTSVIGVMEGTFSKPMNLGGGKVIAPTGKTFKLTMNTVAHWKNGVMQEEYLFWDNAGFMAQIGVGP
ncbi:MAG: ester cyclase [Gemmatimonadaceae bacterium]|nr:ester cyclase [Caulobacter sp.]